VVLRRSNPNAARPFRTPAANFVGILGALTCLVMMVGLPHATQRNFLVWIAIGLVVYFGYSRHHSRVGKASPAADA
jgi:APA family basic amino acid/polyamine antiporter